MAINQRLDLKQGQTLTMTPQLQQAIKLLQMTNLELSEFIEAELEKNPLLERDDGGNAEPPAPESADTGDAPPAAAENEGFENDGEGEYGSDYRDSSLDADFGNVFTGESRAEQMEGGMAAVEGGYDAFATNSFSDVGKGGSASFEDSAFSLENTMAQETSLREHVGDQIKLEFDSAQDRAIALVILDYLDESGYMRADLATLAERLGCGVDRIEGILQSLQRFDPPGIFARNLSECLALQLRELDRLDPAMQSLLDHLDLLAAHDLKKLKSLCGVDEDDLKQMIHEIKALNPKPALAFDHFISQTVVPDVLMKPLPKSRGGGWAVELNTDTLPRVLVNKVYYAEISKNAKAKPDKEYLAEQMNTANWLVKAMDQRAQTILKTASEIILQQEAFFNYGVEFLKPLVLKDVSAAISMHESTVSRVTTGKYIGTPRGVFELKYFFTSGVGSTAGGTQSFSSEAVKARIKALIDAEPPSAILSDDDLVDLLVKEGIDIARRTVAKYREAMKYPSSVQRRRAKNG
jgi:RNA polymerase sigma-54 factor